LFPKNKIAQVLIIFKERLKDYLKIKKVF